MKSKRKTQSQTGNSKLVKMTHLQTYLLKNLNTKIKERPKPQLGKTRKGTIC